MSILSFFRRKKEDKEKKPTLGLAPKKDKKDVKMVRVVGEVLKVFVKEEENLKVDKGGKFSYTGKGKLEVQTVAESPVYSIEVELDGLENTTFKKKRIFIPSLTKVNNIYSWTQDYELKKRTKPSLEINSMVKSDGGEPILVYNRPTTINLTMSVKNNLDGEIDNAKVVFNTINGTKLIKHSVDNGFVSFDRNALIWDKIKLPAGGEAKIEADFEIVVSSIESINFGETAARYSLSENTVSGLKVKSVRGMGKVTYSIVKDQRERDPLYWDCVVKLENPNDYPVNVNGRIKLKTGEIIKNESVEVEGIKLGKNLVEINDLTMGPASTVNIGPIALKSDEIPQFEVDIAGYVKGSIKMETEGKIEVEPLELKVIGGDMSKEIDIIKDEIYKSVLKEDEIPSIGKTPINVRVEIENTGSIPMNYIKIVEHLPKGFSSPEKVKIEINERNVTKSFTTVIEPSEQIENERMFKLEVNGSKEKAISLKPGEKLVLTYILYSERPMLAGKLIKFDSEATVGPNKGSKQIELRLPVDKIPKVKVKPISHQIEVSQDVIPTGEDTFEAKITVVNRGDLPVINYELKARIPKTFEVESYSIQPVNVDEKAKEVVVKWAIEKLEPREKMEITYRVKGVGEYRLEDLMKIIEG